MTTKTKNISFAIGLCSVLFSTILIYKLQGNIASQLDTAHATTPNAPSSLYVNDSTTGAQTGLTNPTHLSTTNLRFSAIFEDPDAGDTSDSYQLLIVINSK